MIRNHMLPTLALALAASLVLAACDRRDATVDDEAVNPPPVATTPAPEAMPPAGEPEPMVTVTTVDLGNAVGADNRVATPITTFATADTFHASVATAGNGGTVSTRWTFQDGQVVHTEDKIVPGGPQITDFMVTNAQGWPTGTYTVEVMVDGQVVQTREFEVR